MASTTFTIMEKRPCQVHLSQIAAVDCNMPGLRWENKPVWCLHNGTATILRRESGCWALQPVDSKAPSHEQTSRPGSSNPCGDWDSGIVVTVKRETPSLIATLAFPAPELDYNFYATGGLAAVDTANGATESRALLTHPGTRFLRTQLGEVVPAIRIRHHGQSRCTILYSHGNGEDLGQIIDAIEELSIAAAADVFAYDYVGYSTSRLEGRAPSEEGCYRAIAAAWDHLICLGVTASSIVLYGRSIGSGPTVELAVQPRCAECAGVILESPMASAAKAIAGSMGLLAQPVDIFLNYLKVGKIGCPVGIMHGTEDELVPFSNGLELHSQLQQPAMPLWCEGYGHHNMPTDECLEYVSQFLDIVGLRREDNVRATTCRVM